MCVCQYVYSHTRICELIGTHKYVYMHMCIGACPVVNTCKYYALTLTYEASQVFCFRAGRLLFVRARSTPAYLERATRAWEGHYHKQSVKRGVYGVLAGS